MEQRYGTDLSNRYGTGTEAKLRQAGPSWVKIIRQLETFHGRGKKPLTDPPREQESSGNKAKEGKCSTLLNIAQRTCHQHATSTN